MERVHCTPFTVACLVAWPTGPPSVCVGVCVCWGGGGWV